jgi:hypothetical protein
VFAAVWAFGGALCEKDGVKYRQQFDKWWKVGVAGGRGGAGEEVVCLAAGEEGQGEGVCAGPVVSII